MEDQNTPQPEVKEITPPMRIPDSHNEPAKLSRVKILILGICAVMVLASFAGAYFLGKNSSEDKPAFPNPSEKVCSQEAMICPDGSSVGRTGPNCEFAPCPEPQSSTSAETADWKLYTNTENGYTIKYPSDGFVRLICPNEELTLIVRGSDTRNDVNMPTCARDGRYDIEIITNPKLEEPTTNQYVTVEKENIEVDGKPAFKYKSAKKAGAEGPISDYEENIFVSYNAKKYLIYISTSISEETRNLILSTFKFL